MVDELKKAKQIHTKNLERYLKLVQETEQTIRSKYAAAAALVGETEPVDRDVSKDGSNLFNRSISKVRRSIVGLLISMICWFVF